MLDALATRALISLAGLTSVDQQMRTSMTRSLFDIGTDDCSWRRSRRDFQSLVAVLLRSLTGSRSRKKANLGFPMGLTVSAWWMNKSTRAALV